MGDDDNVMETDHLDDTNSKDSEQLLKIFPIEIWEHIFDRVTNFNDLHNVFNASLFFRTILLPRRTTFLFPKVWEYLAENYEKAEDEVYTDNRLPQSTYLLFVLPNISHGPIPQQAFRKNVQRRVQWNSTVLKCRSICKAWNTGVDSYYQKLNLYKMQNDLHKDSEFQLPNGSTLHFLPDDNHRDIWNRVETFDQSHSPHLRRFLHHFGSSHGIERPTRSPLLNRAITVKLNSNDDRGPRFSSDLTNLFIRDGMHLMNCSFEVDGIPLSFEGQEQYLSNWRLWLPYMSALKTLKFRYPDRTRSHYRFDRDTILSAEVLAQLQNSLIANPLPKLGTLQFLSTFNVPTPILNHLLEQNSHISILEVKRTCVHEDCAFDLLSVTLPNLKQLSLEMFSEEDFQKLESPEATWPLNKLHLDFGRCDVFIEWSRIFSVLEDKWAGTLTDVMIDLPKSRGNVRENFYENKTSRVSKKKRVVKERSILTLNLPKVKCLSLVIRDISTLDFLMPLKNSLHDLEITYRCFPVERRMRGVAEDLARKQKIQFLECFDSMLRSNIWKIFSSLERFCFRYGNDETGRVYYKKEVKNVGTVEEQ